MKSSRSSATRAAAVPAATVPARVQRRREGHRSGHVLGPRAAPAFLPAAVDQGFQPGPAAHEQRAAVLSGPPACGRRCSGHQRRVLRVSSGSQPAAWTASVWNGIPLCAGQCGQPGNRLHRAHLVVGVHNADQRRFRPEHGGEGSLGDPAVGNPPEPRRRLKPWTRSRYRADSSTAGCSTALITTRSSRGSAVRRARAMPLTARLSASVPPEVKTTSPGPAAQRPGRRCPGPGERRGGGVAERMVARGVAELPR